MLYIYCFLLHTHLYRFESHKKYVFKKTLYNSFGWKTLFTSSSPSSFSATARAKARHTHIPSTWRGRSLWSVRLSVGPFCLVCRRPRAARRPTPKGNRSSVRRFSRPRATPSVPCEKTTGDDMISRGRFDLVSRHANARSPLLEWKIRFRNIL